MALDLDLQTDLAELVDGLAASRGVVGVMLGGSRASGEADEESDWDLAVYYRGELDLSALARFGPVHAPGSWGRIMNGGAWLSIGGRKVDVLLRDLEVASHWAERARAGEYEVDALLGYLAGVPTYSLLAELALGVPLHGVHPAAGGFPERLAAVAPQRWRFHRRFSLEYAMSHARRGDRVGALGQVARAVIEESHAILCARREWVTNEKRLVGRAGLGALDALVAQAPGERDGLCDWVASVRHALDSA